VPRDMELDRYQIPQDRVINYEHPDRRAQEEYDRYRREEEEEEQSRARQEEIARKEWERIQREQEFQQQPQDLVRLQPLTQEDEFERPRTLERIPEEGEDQDQQIILQHQQIHLQQIQHQGIVVEGQEVVYQELRRPEDHKVDLSGAGEMTVINLQTDGNGTIHGMIIENAPTDAELLNHDQTLAEDKEQKFVPKINNVVNLKKPVFFDELHQFYESSQHTDTIIRCKDGLKRAHSIVLGAASSLFRFMFAEIAEKILDSEYVIFFPDLTIQELEELLKPVYGFSKQPQESVKTNGFGFKLDFNTEGIYEAKMREKEKEKKREEELKLIPEHLIKQEKGRRKYDLVDDTSDDEDYRPKKTKHGYKYDSFVESTTDDSDLGDNAGLDESFDDLDDLDDSKPKKRGRKKGSKNRRPYTKRIKSEPLLSIKEEAIDKTFDEFNEMFLQKTQVTRNAEIKFAQDHIGFYHCQEEECSFKTMVRPSIHQHHKFTHQNLHGYQEALLGCISCGESWVNQIYYRKHVDSNECKVPNPVIPYVCENCGQGWYNLTNYTKHAESRECKTNTSHVGKKACSNPACPLTFFSDKNLETHENRAHKPISAGTMYRCAKCNINFINHKDFNKHKKDVHGEKPRGGFVVYVCKIPGCEFQQNERKGFEAHVREAHPDECFICDLCGRNFQDAYKLDQHKENNPNGRGGKRCLPVNYNCPHCPREFNRKRHMELHVLFKHTQERPFGCDQCGKRFKTRHCVNVHLRSHGIGGYSWCCEECGKTFNQISAYHTHLKVHSNVRDFACEDCGMTFKLKHSLKKHQLVHKPEFGHTCDFCGKKFKRSDNLINHRRRHTGEHPYKCDKCNWTGPDSSSFIHHKKKHADVVQNSHTQELKLIHAISKLPQHLLDQRGDPMNGRLDHNDIADIKYV